MPVGDYFIPIIELKPVEDKILNKYGRMRRTFLQEQKTSKYFGGIYHKTQIDLRIHPFQDGNGRVGRLIMFKECLKYNIVPFIIEDSLKMFYYRGLKEWNNEKGYLTDTCLVAQDKYKAYLDYFRIAY